MSPNVFPSANTDSLSLFIFLNLAACTCCHTGLVCYQASGCATRDGHLFNSIIGWVGGWGLGGGVVSAQLSQSALQGREGGRERGDKSLAGERERKRARAPLCQPPHSSPWAPTLKVWSGPEASWRPPPLSPATLRLSSSTGICIGEGLFSTAGSISAASDRLCGGLVSPL